MILKSGKAIANRVYDSVEDTLEMYCKYILNLSDIMSLGIFSDKILNSEVLYVGKAMVDLPTVSMRLASGLSINAMFWNCNGYGKSYSSRDFEYNLRKDQIENVDGAIVLLHRYLYRKPIERFVFDDANLCFEMIANGITFQVLPSPSFRVADFQQRMLIMRSCTFLYDGERWVIDGINMTLKKS